MSTVCFVFYRVIFCPTHRNLLDSIMTNAESTVKIISFGLLNTQECPLPVMYFLGSSISLLTLLLNVCELYFYQTSRQVAGSIRNSIIGNFH
jgi:hypothetical protein